MPTYDVRSTAILLEFTHILVIHANTKVAFYRRVSQGAMPTYRGAGRRWPQTFVYYGGLIKSN